MIDRLIDFVAGQRLRELSSPDVGRLQPDAQKAEQDLNLAGRSLERVQKLRADGAVSDDKELFLRESEFKKSRSDAERNGARWAALGISTSDPAVKGLYAPEISGTVVSRTALAGQEVRADALEPLVTISGLSNVWVAADVNERYPGSVSNGDTVLAHAAAYPEQVFEGTVTRFGDIVDSQRRTVKVRCVFQNTGHRLKPEMFVKVDVRSEADNTFRARNVDIGPEQDGRVRLLRGLHPGERIVMDGALFLDQELRN